MLDDVAGYLDTADALLAGPEAGTPEDGTPRYIVGGPVDRPDRVDPRSAAVGEENPNPIDSPLLLDFIHYGHVYADDPRRFAHILLDDSDGDPLNPDRPPRAIQFRAALQREALLLDGFLQSSREALQEYADNGGVLGGLAAVGTMLAAGGAARPEASHLDGMIDDARQAGGLANATVLEVGNLHQAGVDLHAVRATYRQYAQTFQAGGNGPTLPYPTMPGVAKGIKTVAGIVFKAFDITLEFYKGLCAATEPGIEAACRARSLDAIQDGASPVFNVWSPPPPQDAPPAPPKQKHGGPLGALRDEVEGTVDDVKQEIDDVKQDIKDFLGGPKASTPGDRQLKEAFDTLETTPAIFSQAMATQLELGSMPGFLDTILEELAEMDRAILYMAYRHLAATGGTEPLSREVFVGAGTQYLTRRVLDLLIEFIPFLDFLDSGNPLASLQGISLSGQQLKEKAIQLLDENATSRLGAIIEFAMGDLCDALEAVRAEAATDGNLTMEVFLGRLPWLMTRLVRNTFFPVWDLVIGLVFGKLNDILDTVLGPVRDALGTVQGIVSDVKDVVDKVQAVQENLANGVQLDQDFFEDPEEALFGPEGGEAEVPAGSAPYPGSPRVVKSRGVAVRLADLQALAEPSPLLQPESDDETTQEPSAQAA